MKAGTTFVMKNLSVILMGSAVPVVVLYYWKTFGIYLLQPMLTNLIHSSDA